MPAQAHVNTHVNPAVKVWALSQKMKISQTAQAHSSTRLLGLGRMLHTQHAGGQLAFELAED